ncbi:BON domain-containing protein [Undibacterium sp.]|jgi:hypothetical protein|uniref:BON domain-containing protein n=1 Tax=Undibacterium sp. TaxID=1914977 RepID=UPI002C2995C1|nr:BON domain-containing protein [Undibacterium sp.]HTD04834.1 BON domain-containing protein [Undibacterium sp.]
MSWKKLVAAVALVWPVFAWCAGPPVLKNWFNDPFIQLSRALPACPVPLGPMMAEADIKQEEHSRVERGTTCWLSGKCEKPNAYMYDQDIAGAVRQSFGDGAAFGDSSLWITVKRKFVWVEGCMADPSQSAALEKMLRAAPHVEAVFIDVMRGVEGKPPYVAKSGTAVD